MGEPKSPNADEKPDDESLPEMSEIGPVRPAAHAAEETGISAGQEINGFQILEEVGRGGMGIVYRAFEHRLSRIVALKVLNPAIAQNPSIAKRFRREGVLAANLSHPNIVPVFHIDKSEMPRYFAMEFIPGRSVKEKIDKEGFLSPAEAARLAIQASEALAYAHKRGILHRDVKPSNILLQNHTERVRITDFGIAQDVTGNLAEVTQTEGMTLGTPAFMSPEQNLGQALDERTDIFSLGMTLYYMLTGRIAYTAQNRQQLALAFKEQTPLPPSKLNPDVDKALDAIVMRMISVDPDNRHVSAGEVSRQLRDYLELCDTMPKIVAAARPSRKSRRTRTLYTTIGVLLLAIVIYAATRLGNLVEDVERPGSPQPAVLVSRSGGKPERYVQPMPTPANGIDFEGAFVELYGDAGWDYVAVFNDTGYIGIHTSPQGWVVPKLLSYSTNTWYYVKRELDLGTNTGSFYVEELTGVLGTPSNRSASHSIGRNPRYPNRYIDDIRIWTSTSHGACCFIDDLSIADDTGSLFSDNFDRYTLGDPPTSPWADYYTGVGGKPNYTLEEAVALGVTLRITDEYSISGKALRFLDTARHAGCRVDTDPRFSSSSVVLEYYMMTK